MKYLLLFTLLLSVSCRRDNIDISATIPEHSTHPTVLYDVHTHEVECERFEYRWDLGKIMDESEVCDTMSLGEPELVCHTLSDINRHTAWVKRSIRPRLSEVMNLYDIPEAHQDHISRVVEAAIDRYLTVDIPGLRDLQDRERE